MSGVTHVVLINGEPAQLLRYNPITRDYHAITANGSFSILSDNDIPNLPSFMRVDALNHYRSFGEWFESIRTRERLTRREVAELLDLEPETILRWERDERFPRKEQLHRIAHRMNVTQTDRLYLGFAILGGNYQP